MEGERKVVRWVTLWVVRGEGPKVSGGRQRADWVYVSDVIEGFLAAAITPRIEGKSIDLGTGSLVSVRGVVDRLVKITGAKVKPLFGALPDRPGENEVAANTATASE